MIMADMHKFHILKDIVKVLAREPPNDSVFSIIYRSSRFITFNLKYLLDQFVVRCKIDLRLNVPSCIC